MELTEEEQARLGRRGMDSQTHKNDLGLYAASP